MQSSASSDKPSDLLSKLPTDILLPILQQGALTTRDLLIARRVCRSWHETLTDSYLCLRLLRWHFPRCREVRLADERDHMLARRKSGDDTDEELEGQLKLNFLQLQVSSKAGGETEKTEWEYQLEADYPQPQVVPSTSKGGQDSLDWARIFAHVARRYYHLLRAEPRVIQEIKDSEDSTGQACEMPYDYRPARHLFEARQWDPAAVADVIVQGKSLHRSQTRWSYCARDSLLAYINISEDAKWCLCIAEHGREFEHAYRVHVLDLQTGQECIVNFCHMLKPIHSIRLAEGLLFVNWLEGGEVYDSGPVWDHHGRVYEVRRTFEVPTQRQRPLKDLPWYWLVIPAFSLPVRKNNMIDAGRHIGFFLRDHYLAPTHIFRLFTTHSATHYAVCTYQERLADYREYDHAVEIYEIPEFGKTVLPLKLVRRIPHLGSLLGWPAGLHLRDMVLDRAHLYFVEDRTAWRGGESAFSTHHVRSTSILITPPPKAQSTSASGHTVRRSPFAQRRECGTRATDRAYTLCRKQIPLRSTVNPTAATRLRKHPLVYTIPERPVPPVTIHNMSREIQSLRRSPEVPPCWRHEKFPFVTVAEAVDAAAGIRFVARYCYELHRASPHFHPRVSICQSAEAKCQAEWTSTSAEMQEDMQELLGEDWASSDPTAAAVAHLSDSEIELDKDWWLGLMRAGKLAGDERWLIGEGSLEGLVVLRF